MKRTSLLIASLFLFTIAACKKDNRVAAKIDGSWEVAKQVVNNVATIEANLPKAISFEKCKPTEGEPCTGIYVDSKYAESEFAWTVTDDGTKLSMTIPVYPGVYSIKTSKRKELEIEGAIDGNTVYFLLKK